MNPLSTAVVSKFLKEDFIPNLNRTITVKETTQKVVKRMPTIVAKNLIQNVVQSSLKNSYNPEHLTAKSELTQVEENLKVKEPITIPTRHPNSLATPQENPEMSLEKGERHSEKSNSRITTQCTNLVKLIEPEEEQQQQVKKLRKMKSLMKKYEEIKQKNRLVNQQNRKMGVYAQKSSLDQCLYHHTYGYQSEIMEVNPLQLQSIKQNQYHKSLLEILKGNLDQQLQQQRLDKKILQQEQQTKKKKVHHIPLHKIQTIDEENGEYKVRDKKKMKIEKKVVVDKSLKPLYNFEKSSIQSLSRNIESSLIQGVKMITFEEKIVEGQYPHKGYSIKEEHIVKDKTKKQKLKTNSSQSLIYSLQNEFKNHSLIDSELQEQSEKSIIRKHNSVHFSPQSEQKYDALTQFLKRNSNHMTLDTNSRVNEIKLPQIQKRKRNPPKRTSTEQKIIKGLEGIEIQINSPQVKEQIHFSQRLRHFSALSLNKQTQSSLEERENSRQSSELSLSRSKKSIVKDYFKNYKEQFRQKMRGINQNIDLYS